jgi:hypothetical protein
MQTKYLLLFLLCCNLSLAQQLQNGLILPKETANNELCCIFIPQNGFNVYNAPNGTNIGKITRHTALNNADDAIYELYFVAADSDKVQVLEADHLIEISYEIWAISYLERKNGFVKVLSERSSYWLHEKEINEKGFEVTEWQKFLMDNTGSLLGYFANAPGLNLREGPSVKAKRIMTLRGDLQQIIPLKECKGLWNRVKVIIRKEHPCNTQLTEKENILQELEGWIKMIDDSGKPNVGYYARGC